MSAQPSESQTYQAMLEEVEKISKEVASPTIDLDQLVGKVERGYDLIKHMRSRLGETRQKIEKLRADFEKDESST